MQPNATAIEAQLAACQIDCIDYFDSTLDALVAAATNDYSAALFCTQYDVSNVDTFCIPLVQDVVVSVSADSLVRTSHDMPYMTESGGSGMYVEVAGASVINVVSAQLSSELCRIAYSSKPVQVAGINIVPNLARRAARLAV